MITLGCAAFQSQFRFNEYYGLSTDEKPTKATKELFDKYNIK